MSERAKPFVAWLGNDEPIPAGYSRIAIFGRQQGSYDRPVVVTPLLPGDPKPGEVWLWADNMQKAGQPVEIFGAPYISGGGDLVVPFGHDGKCYGAVAVARLRPKPTLKTFKIRQRIGDGVAVPGGEVLSYISVQAESKEAALAKLAAALEEVEP
jgi:hypothetical protein